jgi:hypothetical protein
LGALDEPFASKVKILGGPSMVGSHEMEVTPRGSPRLEKMKDQLIILERIVEQMTDTMCQHGEKVDRWRLR